MLDRMGHDAPRALRFRGRQTVCCHLVAETLDELHAGAQGLGLDRAWYQPRPYPHYDVISQRLVRRVCRRSSELTRRRLLEMVRRCEEARK